MLRCQNISIYGELYQLSRQKEKPMPWIKTDACTGCGICVDACPAGAIRMESHKASIFDKECIRCGQCHDLCPQNAVRHDSERIPMDVAANVTWTKNLLAHFDSPEEKRSLIDRMKRYFNKERKVAEQSMEQMDRLLSEI